MPTISKDIYSNIFNILHSEAFASTVQQLPKNDYMLFYDVVNEKMVFVKDKTEWKLNDKGERTFTAQSRALERKSFAARKAIENKYSFVYLGCFTYPDIDIDWIEYCAGLAAYIRMPEYKRSNSFSDDIKFD